MKFIYFHQHFSTPQGATGIRSYEMAKALLAKGHSVTMVCGTYSGGNTGLTSPFEHGFRKGVVDGIEVIEFELDYSNEQSFFQRTKAFIKFAYKSIKIALTEPYDAIFATTTPLTAALPGIFAKWLRRKTFIFEVRDLWPELPKAMGVIKNPIILFLLSVLEWLAYKSADGHIALSPGIQQGIARHLNREYLQKNEIALIPNGCDLDIFDNDLDAWQPNGIKDDDFVAIFSGTHGIANDLNQIIKVAKQTQDLDKPNIKFVLIGQGKQKAELIKQAQELKLDNVLFLDPVNKQQLSMLFKRANVGMQLLADVPAFYYGTSPNKFFDYISAGLPVINNYPGWVADMLEDRYCGIAVKPNDAAEFANALITLSQSPDTCKKMAENSLILATEKFARPMLANRFVAYLEEVVTQNA